MMGIGSVTSMNNMSGIQTAMTGQTDVKSKNIQNKITGIQQQMQKLSSKEDLSVDEKANERKKLQKEISGLNTKLKRQQDEFRKSQKKEIMMAKLQEDQKPADVETSTAKLQADEANEKDTAEKTTKLSNQNNETSAVSSTDTPARQTGHSGTVITNNNDGVVVLKGEMNRNDKQDISAGKKQADETDETNEDGIIKEETKNTDTKADNGLSHQEIRAIASADASIQQAGRQETVIARIRGGIAILKGEINQDGKQEVNNTEKKQSALEELEKKEERARAFQFSILGEAGNTMKSASDAAAAGAKTDAQSNAENNAFFNALKLTNGEDLASQQMFHVSIS